MQSLARLIAAAVLGVPALAIAPGVTHDVAFAACSVSINRIYFDSPGTDDGSNGSLNAERIQLKNRCSSGKALNGWTIKDAANHRYLFGTYTLAAGGTVKVHTGKGRDTATDGYWGQGWYVWNNTGSETATLRNSAGTLMDKCTYTGNDASYVNC
jgi:Lamin Tail Domain